MKIVSVCVKDSNHSVQYSMKIEIDMFFFFSSRRRHTRCLSDWSSDVCSSDLIQAAKGETEVANAMNAFLKNPGDTQALSLVSAKDPSWNATLRTTCVATMLDEIGRASCRERV